MRVLTYSPEEAGRDDSPVLYDPVTSRFLLFAAKNKAISMDFRKGIQSYFFFSRPFWKGHAAGIVFQIVFDLFR